MTRPPTFEDVQKCRKRATVGFEETLGARRTDQATYTGEWLPIATFALLHQNSFVCLDNEVHSTTEGARYKFRESLPSIEYPNLTQIQFKCSQSVEATKKYDSIADHANQVDDDQRPKVIVYGLSERFWQALGAFEIAKQGYIVFPEGLSNRWGYGCPDLTCFQLGRLQEVLADLGIVPGGAPIQEIELRTAYENFASTSITATNMVGVAEAKGDGKAKKGRRELEDYRNSRKSPYLEGRTIEKGWLLAPNASEEIQAEDSKIGGVTWEDGQSIYIEPSKCDIDEDESSAAVRTAKRMVLDIVLRQNELSGSLESTIEDCLADPERLYSVFDC